MQQLQPHLDETQAVLRTMEVVAEYAQKNRPPTGTVPANLAQTISGLRSYASAAENNKLWITQALQSGNAPSTTRIDGGTDVQQHLLDCQSLTRTIRSVSEYAAQNPPSEPLIASLDQTIAGLNSYCTAIESNAMFFAKALQSAEKVQSAT